METVDRVRKASPTDANQKIDDEIFESINYYYYHPEEIDKRIEELEKEWDIERVLQLNAALIMLSGLVLGASVNKKWLILSSLVAGFLTQHAVQGWCPPVPLFRSLGIRTRQEIAREKYGLKMLRGDFDVPSRPREIWYAVK